MEITLALIVFAILILAWLVLPGSTTQAAPEWAPADGLQMAPAES